MQCTDTQIDRLALENRRLKLAIVAVVGLVAAVAWRSGPRSTFDELTARELSIVDADGNTLAELRPGRQDHDAERYSTVVFTLGSGDRRIELKTTEAGGEVTVGGRNTQAILWATSGEPAAAVIVRNRDAQATLSTMRMAPRARLTLSEGPFRAPTIFPQTAEQ